MPRDFKESQSRAGKKEEIGSNMPNVMATITAMLSGAMIRRFEVLLNRVGDLVRLVVCCVVVSQARVAKVAKHGGSRLCDGVIRI